MCLFGPSCAQGGAPAEVHQHMWVRAWLWVKAEFRVCKCVWVDEMCGCLRGCWLIFTGSDSPEGIHVQACLKHAGSRALAMPLSYGITQRLPEAWQELPTQTKSEYLLSFMSTVKAAWVFGPRKKKKKLLALHLLSELSLTCEALTGFLSHNCSHSLS